jgi:hypothetical protein
MTAPSFKKKKATTKLSSTVATTLAATGTSRTRPLTSIPAIVDANSPRSAPIDVAVDGSTP